jgi:hypothetical protein
MVSRSRIPNGNAKKTEQRMSVEVSGITIIWEMNRNWVFENLDLEWSAWMRDG